MANTNANTNAAIGGMQTRVVRAMQASFDADPDNRADGCQYGNWFPYFPGCRKFWAEEAQVYPHEMGVFNAAFDRMRIEPRDGGWFAVYADGDRLGDIA